MYDHDYSYVYKESDVPVHTEKELSTTSEEKELSLPSEDKKPPIRTAKVPNILKERPVYTFKSPGSR